EGARAPSPHPSRRWPRRGHLLGAAQSLILSRFAPQTGEDGQPLGHLLHRAQVVSLWRLARRAREKMANIRCVLLPPSARPPPGTTPNAVARGILGVAHALRRASGRATALPPRPLLACHNWACFGEAKLCPTRGEKSRRGGGPATESRPTFPHARDMC